MCDIPTGWSLQLVPPAIRLAPDHLTAVAWAWPPASDHGYTGTLTIHGKGRWSGGDSVMPTVPLHAWVTYQLCGAENCLPEVTVAVALTVTLDGGG